MRHRYRFIGSEAAPGVWELDADEAHHLTKVLRLPEGTEVEVTDGRGAWALGTVAKAGGKQATIAAGATQHEASSPWRLTVAVGALKPGLVDELLPGLVELGVDRIAVFQQRGDAKARLAGSAQERWHRIVVSAIKQCKRAHMPTVDVHASLEALVQDPAVADPAAQRLVLAPGAAQSLWTTVAASSGRDLILLAGGERGLDDADERLLAASGFTGVSMGPTILRAYTAALAAAAVAALRRAAT